MAFLNAPSRAAATESLFTIATVRTLNGASRHLPCPHILVETLSSEGLEKERPSLDRCRVLDGMLQVNADDSLHAKPADADLFELFGSLCILIQRNGGFEVHEVAVNRAGDRSAMVAVEYLWAPAAASAARVAIHFIDYLVGRAIMKESEIRRVLARYQEACSPGPSCSQRHLYMEARRRGIPVAFIPPYRLQFGHGCQMQSMQRQFTEKTSFLAVQRATNKTVTLRTLQNAGLPVPEHFPVTDPTAAVAAAMKIGFPVVVKPATTDRGVGITAGVTTASAVANAYKYARQFDQQVAVERYVLGDTIRLLVINGKFIAASLTEQTPIIGDGRSTIRELVDIVNSGRQRGPGYQKPLTWLQLDDEALGILRSLDLTPASVLSLGQTIRLRTASNLSRGGRSVAVTEKVHPENRQMAERCAKIIGLDLAGIDFRTGAIDRSWRDTGGAVIEVNPTPGLRMHLAPERGIGSDIASPIFDLLYPNGQDGRIPLIAVTGTNGKTTTTRLIAHVLRACGFVTGRTTTDEAAVDDDIIMWGDCAGPGPARRILAIPYVEAVVLETARGGLIKYGLGYQNCDVAIVTNVEADHLGELGIATVEELAKVKSIVAKSAERAVILNADDTHCLAMRSTLAGPQIVLFSMDQQNAEVSAHLKTGGTAYVLSKSGDDEVILRATPSTQTEVARIKDLPITMGGYARHNIQNAMAALAALEQLDLEPRKVVDAVKTFVPTLESNPGRLNTIEGFPFTVMLDYAHNEHGFKAIAEFVRFSRPQGRKICVVSMNAGRVSDSTAQEAMKSLAGAFDAYVTFSHRSPKKRREGFGDILRQGLLSQGVDVEDIQVRDDEETAIGAALELANPGDLVMLLIGYEPREVRNIVESFVPKFEDHSMT